MLDAFVSAIRNSSVTFGTRVYVALIQERQWLRLRRAQCYNKRRGAWEAESGCWSLV